MSDSVAVADQAELAADLREIDTAAGTLRHYDVGDGPPVLFLHGSGPGVTGWRNFRGVLPAFARYHRCLVLEFPGFGVSDDWGGHPMVTAQAPSSPFSTRSVSIASTSSVTRSHRHRLEIKREQEAQPAEA